MTNQQKKRPKIGTLGPGASRIIMRFGVCQVSASYGRVAMVFWGNESTRKHETTCERNTSITDDKMEKGHSTRKKLSRSRLDR